MSDHTSMAINHNPEGAVIDRARHGQHDSSRETGDCFRASMSVLLDVPNGDHLPHGIDTEDWWTNWWRFLFNLGLAIAHDNAQGPIWKEHPWIASVRSLNYEGATHAIVMHRTSEVLFDPSPLQRYEGSLLGEDVVIGGTWLELADVSRIDLLVAFRAEHNQTAATDDGNPRRCDRCGGSDFLSSAWGRDRKPVWLCRTCIGALTGNGQHITPESSVEYGSDANSLRSVETPGRKQQLAHPDK